MRQILLSIIIAFCLTTTVKSQTLVDTNKVWNVVECVNFGGCGTTVFHFYHDTTIGIHQYKRLSVNKDSSAFFGYSYPIAAREDSITKQVFFYYNSECLAYDFSLNKGDTFSTNFNGCPIQMVVDSVDMVTLLNGELRKRLLFSDDTWIEGIGSLYGLPYVNIYQCLMDVWPELICFKENDTLKYHNLGYNSCYFTTVGISETNISDTWTINPNPFTDYSTLTYQDPNSKNHTLSIYNATGQIVRKILNITDSKIIIERGELKSGLYLFRLKSDRQCIGQGKFIIE